MVRIFSRYSIKKVFNLIFFSTFILIFCLSNTISAKTLFDNNIKCGQSSVKLIEDQSYLTSSSHNFKKVVSKIENVDSKDYNLIIFSGYKPSPGYRINISKIKMKKKSIIIY